MESKKIKWYGLALMAFSSVWSFGNVINGFSEFGGLKAVVPWVLIFATYFVPYALMVGELGSAFKDASGGVSSWIQSTISPRIAYYAGWTYWVVHMPYISQKPNSTVIAVSWAIFQDNRVSQMNTLLLGAICLGILLLAMTLASRGLSIIKNLSAIAGGTMFVMSLLYIVLMVAAPSITQAPLLEVDWSIKAFMPTFDAKFFLSLSILVFAVGGCEKISPYVNKMEHPARDFPRGMIALAVMVTVCAVLGTVSMGMMFDSNNIPKDLLTNGAYYAFQQLGEYYNVGNFFVVAYAITTLIGQFSIMVLSIDAPLCILLNGTDKRFIPEILLHRNKHGAYSKGHLLITMIVSVLIIVPAFGIQDVDALVRWLVKLNAVCMPLRYLWVFVAYIALKKAGEKHPAAYRFVRSKPLGIALGVWCFAVTAFSCIGGIYSKDAFQFVMNLMTPFILLGLGFIMPFLAKRKKLN